MDWTWILRETEVKAISQMFGLRGWFPVVPWETRNPQGGKGEYDEVSFGHAEVEVPGRHPERDRTHKTAPASFRHPLEPTLCIFVPLSGLASVDTQEVFAD